MSKLFCIASKEQYEQGDVAELLQTAANEQGISFVHIDPKEFNFVSQPILEDGDMLYRAETGAYAGVIERQLVHKGVITFYTEYMYALRPIASLTTPHLLALNDVPIVPTVYTLPSDRKQLTQYVEYLGGTPLIIKEMGGSHGVGVMKIESLDSLFSVVDVLLSKGGSYIMRKYIDYAEHLRLIVLGNEVVATVNYPRVEQDFRSNVGSELCPEPATCSDEVKQVAVDAVHAKGLEFGGVDMLIDTDGKPYVAEANFPCFFPRAQHALGVDVSGMMVKFLKEKSERSLGAK